MQTEYTRGQSNRAYMPERELKGVTIKRNPSKRRWEVWEGSTYLMGAKGYSQAVRLWRHYVEERKED